MFRRWDVVGSGRREKAKCPYCFSSDRARLVLLYLKTQTRVFDTATRLLYIAPDKHLADVLSRADTVDYVCGDLEPALIRTYRPVRLDVRALPFKTDHFDVILCNQVMEYVREDELGFREIYRVLRPGGTAVLQVPIARKLDETQEGPAGMSRRESVRRFGHHGNVRMYGLDYADRLKRAGFQVARRRPFKERWVADIDRHGLDPREDLYAGLKRDKSES